jgi:hypothetical protein
MAHTFCDLAVKDLRRMSYQLAVRNNVKKIFSESKGNADRK